ncbi:DUF1819 family protein [uncultured Endozoicomonas sp.]|uniref:DUF1819 family protein n=1 Tax=uncultured Endozoicomonas sp. TaxID=432652 RepID=UPI002618CD92|nr:DUF1819 family protein [uncultured Endozoicomonas sp.]
MTQPYKLSFTAGSLLPRESLALAQYLLDLGTWELAREKALSENLLQTRTLSTAIRTIREIGHRLKTLAPMELEFLVHSTSADQAAMLWVAICRYYRFIGEFAIEVIREKFLSMSYQFEEEDFDYFFNQKAEWHDELESIQQVTRDKLKQVVFRMLREANLMTKENRIIPAVLSSEFVVLLSSHNPKELTFFPIYDHLLNTGSDHQ